MSYYKSLIPKNVNYKLAPFTIKKGSNIFGLIFGSNHYFGLEKFLNVCWKADPIRGEANFDIDDENLNLDQFNIFTGEQEKPKKLEIFESTLKEKILNTKLDCDRDIYIFTIESGFLPKHANKVIRNLNSMHKIKERNFKLNHKLTSSNAKINFLNLVEK